MNEEEKTNLLKKISKKIYNDEWFIDKAIISFKAQQERTYTFFRDNSANNLLYKYNWCQRPCDTNMSLCHFEKNATVSGWMSESLAERHGLEQITLNEFIYYLVTPLIKENIEFKKQLNIKKCLICGNEFQATRKNQVCCSELCKKKKRIQSSINYIKKANSQQQEKMKEARRKYYEKNKERINEYKKQYAKNNKKRIAERMKRWREANKEHIKEYNKQYRMRNK